MSWLKQIQNKILSSENIEETVNNFKSSGKKIVFTNGCFDIIHRGHIELLSKAADMGDKLIVGLNTDQSVKRLKGDNRPVQDEISRAMIMASFSFVDLVVLFEEDTPYELIREVQPDILVKGGDYKAEDIVGYDIVTAGNGKVITINFVEGYSTTSIVRKMSR